MATFQPSFHSQGFDHNQRLKIEDDLVAACLAMTTAASVRALFLCFIPRKTITGEDARFKLRPLLSCHGDRFWRATATLTTDTDHWSHLENPLFSPRRKASCLATLNDEILIWVRAIF
jgi:hypothetical protein